MKETSIYSTQTTKSMQEFLRDLRSAAEEKGFVFHNEEKMNMAQAFRNKGIQVPEDFDLHMIQICKPEKASQSLSSNPERSPLMPKFINAFSKGGTVQIRMLIYGQDLVGQLVDDPDFPESLTASYQAIMDIIEKARA